MDKHDLNIWISIIFVLVGFATLVLFNWVLRNSNSDRVRKKSTGISLILLSWMILQFYFAWSGLYSDHFDSIPPTIAIFGIIPTLIVMIILLITKSGRKFIDSLPLKEITYLNVVRIPVEIVLALVASAGAIPLLMSFEGQNFDILAGITAPIIAYFGFVKKTINYKLILAWNIISLALLIFIIVLSVLSAPSPFQQLAFDQPNLAMLYFPFSWLPTFIVPVVIFGHLVSIRQLIVRRNEVF